MEVVPTGKECYAEVSPPFNEAGIVWQKVNCCLVKGFHGYGTLVQGCRKVVLILAEDEMLLLLLL